ncbi:uncharacterized protein METZ01_LOCUS75679, partial [marine metagenome]
MYATVTRIFGSTLPASIACWLGVVSLSQAQPASGAEGQATYRALLDEYCVSCHNQALVEGSGDARTALVSQLRAVGLTLDTLDLSAVGGSAAHWEQVVRKLRAGLMPPAGRPRPDSALLDGFRAWLESRLDENW